jgi:S1-C subfamily serine protease
VNLVDLLALALVGLAVYVGYRAGAIRQLGGLLGGGLGLVVAVLGVTAAAHRLAELDALSRVITLIAVFTISFLVGQRIGARAGNSVIPADADGPVGTTNRVAGSLVSVAQTMLLIWLIGGLLAAGPSRQWARLAEGSATVRGLSAVAPAPTVVAEGLQSTLMSSASGSLFSGLGEVTGDPTSLPSGPRARRIAEAAGPSVVKVITTGCRWQSSGSGAVVSPGYIVTNAHVVDGGHSVAVISQSGSHDGTVVGFDPKLDVALVHVPTLAAPPLHLAANTRVGRGDIGVALGYPGGGPLVAARASVNREIPTIGRNPIDDTPVTREVLELHSRVAPGDSGGPFVLDDGSIGGIVFAESPKDPEIGYALPAAAVADAIDPMLGRVVGVDVDPC